MNTQAWITHFERNTRLNDTLGLPAEACTLPEHVRRPLAASIATFQLGESGTGSRLRRYAREVAPLENFRGYQRAIDLFVAEEQSHSRLLARTVEHLGGKLLTKQWTNSVFRRLRFLVNLEFAIQVLLTAELIAEVYFGTLYLRCTDPVVNKVSHKLLRDEMKHLAFQRDFLSERLATFNDLGRWLWRAQFQVIHAITATVVAWDHRHTLRALGVKPTEFRQRCLQAWTRYQERLEVESVRFRNPDLGGKKMSRNDEGSGFSPAGETQAVMSASDRIRHPVEAGVAWSLSPPWMPVNTQHSLRGEVR